MRNPAVSGTFYPGSKKELIDFIEKNVSVTESRDGLVAISPHAGYRYSGRVAGKSISTLRDVDTYIIVGPDHHGRGAALSLSKDRWKTPLGEIEVDTGISDKLTDIAVYDSLAHEQEHSIEVQLPFLQYLHKDFKIVPISMGLQDKETAIELSQKILEIMEEYEVALISSSDFTHYESESSAKKKDKKAIEKILNLDIDGFYNTVRKNNISICGYGPIAVAIEIARNQEVEGELLEYTTSAETTGDRNQVVGYAAINFR
ncbi:MEMO1 family protein [Methanonatronarchaeum sp. AMET-Sl]|uniref:MEMO1 family protein n=1 Tax=Methanonatronarchaeum sp. AMET-Sl TaxID=3037654 RepID=UPI00244DFE93|nr:MEMO1 family protein [Methanonatronarchaeum sp. AMET-Sl]WGI17312.1 MEMO1 family protein [Methanonatronarchaeum sp. AMET-Sl]